jgi:phage shock protein PspC (stress-responsive transcriptional regulator)
MKKTINITLNGLVFSLEEDAYEKLKAYLDSIEAHYDNKIEAQEIIADIESSIGEKFSEKTSSEREAISAQDVDEVIRIMGTVEEITQDDQPSGKRTEYKHRDASSTRKKLYRDTDDVVIAGVASGIAAYFGIDPLIVRILFILGFFANGFSLVVYLVLWVALPKAETSAQKLEMQGRPVSLSEIELAVKEKSKLVAEEGGKAIRRLKQDSALVKLLNLPIIILKAIFVFIGRVWDVLWPLMSAIAGAVLIIGSIFAVIGLSIASTLMVININSPLLISDLPLAELASMPNYYIAVISFYLSSVLPMIILTALGIMLVRRKNTFRLVSTSVIVGVWMLSVIIFAVSAFSLIPVIRSKTTHEAAVSSTVKTHAFKDLIIRTDVKQYSPAMSSIRGIGLSFEFYDESGRDVFFRYSTSHGYLTENFEEKNFFQEIDLKHPDQKIFWTYFPAENALSTSSPISVSLEAKSANNGETVASAQLKLAADEQGMVRIVED